MRTSRTYKKFTIPYENRFLEEFGEFDIRSPEKFVEFLIKEYTKPGDTVFDPFAGLGTTLLVSEKMNRKGFGISFNEKKYNYIKKRLSAKKCLKHGDARKIKKSEWPQMDFCYTSPPYMRTIDEENPFSDYEDQGTYEDYLNEMQKIFQKVLDVMKPGAYIIVELANMIHDDQVTTLAWDAGNKLRQVMHLRGEIIICWERKMSNENSEKPKKGTYGYGMDHSYCLVFQK